MKKLLSKFAVLAATLGACEVFSSASVITHTGRADAEWLRDPDGD